MAMHRIALALRRSRVAIAVMAATYVVSVTSGIIAAHRGAAVALRGRDRIVHEAHRSDASSRADDRGAHAQAAAIDFGRNLALGGIPDTIGGLLFVMPVGTAMYRGWVGGIVSVDGRHRSRFRTPASARYYIITMLLQLSAFTLAGAAGLHLGYDNLWGGGARLGPAWLRLPREGLADVAALYALVVPLFACGSAFEFLISQ